MKIYLTALDYEIIKMLNKNARLSSNAIATELNVSQRTVKNHINYLLKHQVIRPVAIINPDVFGYNNIADIFLWTEDHHFEEIFNYCKQFPEVTYFSKHWENETISIQARFKSFNNLTQFINNLKNNPLISKIEYTIIPEVLFDTDSWLPKVTDFVK